MLVQPERLKPTKKADSNKLFSRTCLLEITGGSYGPRGLLQTLPRRSLDAPQTFPRRSLDAPQTLPGPTPRFLVQPERFKPTKRPTQTSYFQELAWQPARLASMTAGTQRGLSGDSGDSEVTQR